MATRRNRAGETPGGETGWMVTFSDLITLLLTFFVLIICIANLDPRILENAFASIRPGGGSRALDYGAECPSPQLGAVLEEFMNPPDDQPLPDDLKYVLFQLEPPEDLENPYDLYSLEEFADPAKAMEYNQALAAVEVTRDERGLVIRWDGEIVFPEGRALVQPIQAELLERLAAVLAELAWPVSIEAHTDPDSPLEGGQSRAAFDLSFARARAVLEIFTAQGLAPNRFRLGAFGPGQARPLADENGQAAAPARRRLEIVLYKSGFGGG